MLGLVGDFLCKNDIPDAGEVFKNLPEAHGFVLTLYQAVASHGDPVRAQNDTFLPFRLLATPHTCCVNAIHVLCGYHACAAWTPHMRCVDSRDVLCGQ